MRLRKLVSALLLLLVSASNVYAQGSFGIISDPMGLAELRELLQRYGVATPENTPAIQTAHADYLARATVLREGEIARLLSDSQSLWAPPIAVERIEDFCRRRKELRRRAGAVDGALFDAIAVADPECVNQLVRVRKSRERSVAGQYFTDPRWGSDLISLALANVSEMERDVVLREMTAYEDRMTGASKGLAEKCSEVEVRMVRGLIERGALVADPAGMSEEEMDAYIRASREAYVAIYKPLVVQQLQSQRMTLEALRTLFPKLSPRNSIKLRRAFCEQFYGSIPSPFMVQVEQRATELLRLKSLSADEERDVRAVFDTWLTSEWSMLLESIALCQKREIEEMEAPVEGSDGVLPSLLDVHAKLDALEQKRALAAEAAMSAMTSLVGDERSKQLSRLTEGGWEDLFKPAADVVLLAGPSLTAESIDAEGTWVGGLELISPGDAEFAWIAACLGVTGPQMEMLKALFADWLEATEGAKQRLSASQALPWSDPETGMPDLGTYEQRRALARDIPVEIQKAKDTFFDRVRDVLAAKEQMRLVQGLRAAAAMDVGVVGRRDQLGYKAVQPLRLPSLRRAGTLAGLTTAQVNQLLEAIAERGPELDAAIGEHALSAAESLHFQLGWWAKWRQLEQGGGVHPDGQQLGLEQEAATISLDRAARRLLIQIKTICGDAIEQWARSQDAATSERTLRAWKYESAPEVWLPDENLDHQAMQILGDESLLLTWEERQSMDQILSDWRKVFDDACNQMIAMAKQTEDRAAGDWSWFSQAYADSLAIQFRRNETSYLGMLRLEALLGKERMAKVPGFAKSLKKLERASKGTRPQ